MNNDFDFFEKWVFENLNIDLTAYNSKQLHRRILSVMNRSGANNLREYSKMISNNPKERLKFLDYITINVSEFFRNKAMFDELEKKIEDILIPKYNKLNIWSAACSIGAEPYSISIILDRLNRKNKDYILATDIDNSIINRAKEGVYSKNEIKNLDNKDIDKYFLKKGSKYHLDNDIKRKVTFKKHDLILDRYENNFHLIVCRNVLIYFKMETKNKIYKKFYDALVPGGLLFVGATENIINYRELNFEKINAFLYRKK
ncbi:MAG: protein-glutamate O-methyltransferase CheR [Firmicutes bacterium]|nr:protein-glutamate O-methyltransferase CheR [Bacillota bacterium]MTI69512.1 protein-glutamate O-methyltransferase CheR [Bacillota bacterium]